MAAPFAYEQPTINSAWQAFIKHLPTIVVIWLIGFGITLLGLTCGWLVEAVAVGLVGGYGENAQILGSAVNRLSQLPFTVISSLVGVLNVVVPVLYYETGCKISVRQAFAALLQRPWRYLLAGLLAALVMTIGVLLCVVPGIAVALVMPVYINRIFSTDQAINDAFWGSFQSVYRHPNASSFILIQLGAWLLVAVVAICTCFIGLLVAAPVATFYVQNSAYRFGILS